MLIIPAIDLKEGRCVRLRQGRMEEDTVFSDDPVEVAQRWIDQGARRLHLVDLDGAFAGRPKNADVIASICRISGDVPVQIGGGIRTEGIAEAYLEMGVDGLIIGTLAVKQPSFVDDLCERFPGHVIVGLDARDGYVATDGWAEASSQLAAPVAMRFRDVGVSAIVYTDISRDGMMQGANVAATAALADAVELPIIASGGVSSIDDIEALLRVGGTPIAGAIVGRALYEGTLDVATAQARADSRADARSSVLADSRADARPKTGSEP